MQYARLKRTIDVEVDQTQPQTMKISVDLFRHLLSVALQSRAVFDEAFYLARYPDVAQAISDGLIHSGAQHYYRAGYFEGRLPAKIPVDERYYVNEQPDIVEGLKSGIIRDVQQHFEDHGFAEGRLPYAGFTLF